MSEKLSKKQALAIIRRRVKVLRESGKREKLIAADALEMGADALDLQVERTAVYNEEFDEYICPRCGSNMYFEDSDVEVCTECYQVCKIDEVQE